VHGRSREAPPQPHPILPGGLERGIGRPGCVEHPGAIVDIALDGRDDLDGDLERLDAVVRLAHSADPAGNVGKLVGASQERKEELRLVPEVTLVNGLP
jgi:hypothetical protein